VRALVFQALILARADRHCLFPSVLILLLRASRARRGRIQIGAMMGTPLAEGTSEEDDELVAEGRT
jgi:hypothetical protein